MGLQLIRRVKDAFLDHLSFGSARARALNIAGILLILAAWPTDKLYLMPVRSVWENVFHVRPYSSGMMRGLSSILHGDLAAARAYNVLAFPTLGILVVLLVIEGRRWYLRSQALSRDAQVPNA